MFHSHSPSFWHKHIQNVLTCRTRTLTPPNYVRKFGEHFSQTGWRFDEQMVTREDAQYNFHRLEMDSLHYDSNSFIGQYKSSLFYMPFGKTSAVWAVRIRQSCSVLWFLQFSVVVVAWQRLLLPPLSTTRRQEQQQNCVPKQEHRFNLHACLPSKHFRL